MFQAVYIQFQKVVDAVFVGQTDIFPHFRRRGSNSGDIFKAASGKGFHETLRGVIFPYHIDQCGSDDMGDVADGSCDIVVLLWIHNNAFGTGTFQQR